MKVYLVGGAVRDQLLGFKPKEYDWVVVGATVEQMLALNYKLVGKDFPVFLHPESHDEYALARTERKTAPGYTGFDVHASPEVTLEQDLMRRDLTINALAQDESGQIIDPFSGQQDLQQKLLRHVSPAFSEDPVRILRLARFAARFADLGFTVATETMQLMSEMTQAGEVDALVAERVWKELEKALATPQPQVFFEILRKCGALARLFPQLEQLFGVPQTEKHHPEIDTGIHTMMVLQQAAKISASPRVRFAALLHDLGKGVTPKDEWPKHIEHEERGVPLVKQLCKRYRIPKDFTDLAIMVARYHLHCHRALELKAQTVLKLFSSIDAWRRPERFEEFLLACEADARGRLGLEDRDYPQAGYLRVLHKAASEIDHKAFLQQGISGKELGETIHKERVRIVKQLIKHLAKPTTP